MAWVISFWDLAVYTMIHLKAERYRMCRLLTRHSLKSGLFCVVLSLSQHSDAEPWPCVRAENVLCISCISALLGKGPFFSDELNVKLIRFGNEGLSIGDNSNQRESTHTQLNTYEHSSVNSLKPLGPTPPRFSSSWMSTPDSNSMFTTGMLYGLCAERENDRNRLPSFSPRDVLFAL